MKFLIIQTAFLGDVVLATPLIEKLHRFYPDASIDFLLRQGNENLLTAHPHLRKVWIWDKNQDKWKNLWQLAHALRREKYDWVVNCHRFFSSGIITLLSRAGGTAGFDKNPCSPFFTRKIRHHISRPTDPPPHLHEVARNLALIEHLTDTRFERPKLYPRPQDYEAIATLLPGGDEPFFTVAPTSVWYTKQLPQEKWLELLALLPHTATVFLLGSPNDHAACESLKRACHRPHLHNLCGALTLLQSAALMSKARMNFVNDSAPLHLASAMNAPVTAIYCSTVPAFGFFPLSDEHYIVQTTQHLPCRPCGLHGFRSCPRQHFSCAQKINFEEQKLFHSFAAKI